MTGTDLEIIRAKTDEVIATLNHPAYLKQLEQTLPEGVTVKRFVGVATAAIRSNADLVNADQTSLFGALVKCAQDGLFPDGREAALAIYKGKVGYLPMIGGIRKIAADHGWTITTNVAYANDEFEYTDEPPVIHHKPVRPGVERGELEYAYAVARHKDGRRVQRVVLPDEVAKRRKMAQTDKVWSTWTPQMWEKTAGHDVFKQLGISDYERVDRVLAAMAAEPDEAAEQLYGADAVIGERVDLETGEITAETAPNVTEPVVTESASASQQAAASAGDAALAAVPGAEEDDEPEPGSPRAEAVDDIAAAKAAGVAGTVIPKGNYKGMTLAAVHELGEEGAEWFAYVVSHPKKYDDAPGLVAAVQVFVDGTPTAQLKAA